MDKNLHGTDRTKKVHQKGPKSEKSYDLGGDRTKVGYNHFGLREVRKSPQLFVYGFDRNVAQLFSDPSLHSLYKDTMS